MAERYQTIDKFGRRIQSSGYRGPPGIGFKFTTDGHFDLENLRLCNVATPQSDTDAVNRDYVSTIANNIHEAIQQSTKTINAEIQQNIKSLMDVEIPKYLDYEDIFNEAIIDTKIQQSLEKITDTELSKYLKIEDIFYYNIDLKLVQIAKKIYEDEFSKTIEQKIEERFHTEFPELVKRVFVEVQKEIAVQSLK